MNFTKLFSNALHIATFCTVAI